GHGDPVGGGDQDESPGLQDDRVSSLQRQPATALDHRAVERLAGIRAADPPRAGADHLLGEARGGLEQQDHFRQWIDHGRTPANEVWTSDCRQYGAGCIPWWLAHHTRDHRMKTVLITGCSSGFGLETARHFLARDWRVVATMRTPRDDLLPASANLLVLPLDVTDPESVRAAVAGAGEVDVLVNNAGFGAPAPFELMDMETVRRLFETNTFGTIAMAQAVLPQMRARGSGVIVNVTSS